MKSVLREIVENKREEVARREAQRPLSSFEKSVVRPTIAFSRRLQTKTLPISSPR
jgi:hypothetical protein